MTRPAFCAICIGDIVGEPYMEPLGRADALVALCSGCATMPVGMHAEKTDRQRELYDARVRDGICVRGRSHGPATHGRLCDRCHETQATFAARTSADTRERRKRNADRGLCRNAISHGAATHGQLCATCHERYSVCRRERMRAHRQELIAQGLCANGAKHGVAVDGVFCRDCKTRDQARTVARSTARRAA